MDPCDSWMPYGDAVNASKRRGGGVCTSMDGLFIKRLTPPEACAYSCLAIRKRSLLESGPCRHPFFKWQFVQFNIYLAFYIQNQHS